MLFTFSCSTPIPVSHTASFSLDSAQNVQHTSINPFNVNLRELLRRFRRIWLNLRGSVNAKSGSSGSILVITERPFFSAWIFISWIVLEITSLSRNLDFWTVKTPS
ncbi:unnamed protein product [Blepharisma stoltei]|uniref:Uncharacterized protein n=1 Tax=Blepharisma stoltei TaxID=1481888 RepID=A0AAU9JH08_9CILI|nr:unnamed protein product [Blepharisma stoltei]